MKLFAVLLLGAALHTCSTVDEETTPATTVTSNDGAAKQTGPTTAQRAPVPALATAAPTLPPPQHFVVIVLDDLTISDANFMKSGAVRRYMPNIDALAAESMVMTNYHAVTAICTPSRFSMLTGTYPSRATNALFQDRLKQEGTAVPEFNTLITSKNQTLPKRMQSLGFRTGFSGKNHVTDSSYDIPANSTLSSRGIAKTLSGVERDYTRDLQQIGFNDVSAVYPTNVGEWPVVDARVHNLDWIADGALKFIDANKSRKFFLFMALTVPHGPFDAAHSWNADPRLTPYGYLATALNVMPARSTLTPRVIAAGFPGTENYLWMDDAVGAVIARLKQYGLMDSTAIIVQGDHGMTAKGSIYVGGSRTPAFWYYRGLKGTTSQLSSMVDLQPTILEMAGGVPAGDGVSLVPLLTNPTVPVRESVYMELGYARGLLQGDYQYITLRHSPYIMALAAKNDWPLTEWLQQSGVHPLEKNNIPLFPYFYDRNQLYNVALDPQEKVNLYAQAAYQPIVAQMAATLQAQVNALPGSYKVIE